LSCSSAGAHSGLSRHSALVYAETGIPQTTCRNRYHDDHGRFPFRGAHGSIEALPRLLDRRTHMLESHQVMAGSLRTLQSTMARV
jgi:hypothetical protein